MPLAYIASARSLYGDALGSLRDNVVRGAPDEVYQRDVLATASQKVNDFKTALSSWDNCMNFSLCKYPVIVVMIVGGLILLGIITCIARCCCCAKACCCSCFRCFQCCGNCCGCCDPPGSRKVKYMDEPYNNPNRGYQAQAPMGVAADQPPQYAEFESSRKGGEDSLPQMPEWQDATSKKVGIEEESLEMSSLQSPAGRDSAAAHTTISNSPHSSIPLPRGNLRNNSAYAPLGGSDAGSIRGGPIPRGAMANYRDPYAPQKQGFDNYSNHGSDGYGPSQPYDMAPPAGRSLVSDGSVNGRNSPAPSYGPTSMNSGYAEMSNMPPGARGPYGPRSPAASHGMHHRNAGQDPYGPSRNGSPYGTRPPQRGTNNSPSPYGMDPSMRGSPAPHPHGAHRTPAPLKDTHSHSARASPAPNSPGFGHQPYSPGHGPGRQYTQSPSPMSYPSNHDPISSAPMPQPYAQPMRSESPILNNSGFDFNSGFSRPVPRDDQSQVGSQAYPGYKPYRPGQ